MHKTITFYPGLQNGRLSQGVYCLKIIQNSLGLLILWHIICISGLSLWKSDCSVIRNKRNTSSGNRKVSLAAIICCQERLALLVMMLLIIKMANSKCCVFIHTVYSLTSVAKRCENRIQTWELLDSNTTQAYLRYCVTPSNYGIYPSIHRWEIVSRRAVGHRGHDDVAYAIECRQWQCVILRSEVGTHQRALSSTNK
jgi:hypothetical protein